MRLKGCKGEGALTHSLTSDDSAWHDVRIASRRLVVASPFTTKKDVIAVTVVAWPIIIGYIMGDINHGVSSSSSSSSSFSSLQPDASDDSDEGDVKGDARFDALIYEVDAT